MMGYEANCRRRGWLNGEAMYGIDVMIEKVQSCLSPFIASGGTHI
jgi:hypothetical protein